MDTKGFDPTKDKIRYRIFPADVVSETLRSFGSALVLVTYDAVYCYADGNPSPQLVFSDRLDAINSSTQGLVLTLSSGHTLSIRKSGNCGCGSRLRHWSPPAKAAVAGRN
jgi:hypothetical protein